VAMERLDIGPCRDVQALMQRHAVLIDAAHANAKQIAAILGRCDWIVTCRYHALVLAMLSGVPAIGLAHDERIAAILDELGFLDDAFVPWDEPRMLEELTTKTRRLRERLPEMRREIERALPGYLDRMAGNARCLSSLLRERFPPIASPR
jgi:polysaccharide pyruvyl transferase WcaK-like protein